KPLLDRNLKRVILAETVGNVVSDIAQRRQHAIKGPPRRCATWAGHRLIQIERITKTPSQIAHICHAHQRLDRSDFLFDRKIELFRISLLKVAWDGNHIPRGVISDAQVDDRRWRKAVTYSRSQHLIAGTDR